ncbi:hypothetical protein GWI33_012771, partial [Rhynchophorus ferrugineus]
MEPYTTFEAIADIISYHISATFPIGNTFVNSRTFEDPLTFISNEYLVCNVMQGPAKYFRAAFETNRSTQKRNVTRAVRTKFGRVPVDVKCVFTRGSYYYTERNIAYTSDQVHLIENTYNNFHGLFRIIHQNRMIRDYFSKYAYTNREEYYTTLTELEERMYQACYKSSSVVRPKQWFALVKCNPLIRRRSTEVFKCLHRRYDRTTDASVKISRSSLGITHLRRRKLRMKKYLVSADFLSITTIQQELIYNRDSLFHDSQEF